MKKTLFISFLVLCINSYYVQSSSIKQFDVIWNDQSKDSWESMPCGGGSLGLNVWVENNDLYILMASPESWITLESRFPGQNQIETPINRKLVKLGRLRIRF